MTLPPASGYVGCRGRSSPADAPLIGASRSLCVHSVGTLVLHRPPGHGWLIMTMPAPPPDQPSPPAMLRASIWLAPAATVAAIAVVGQVLGVLAALILGTVAATVVASIAADALIRGPGSPARAAAIGLATGIVLLSLGWLQRNHIFPENQSNTRSTTAASTDHSRVLDLRGRKVTAADIENRSLVGAQLQGASLAGLDLRGKSLAGASAAGSTFRGSDLEGARLDGIDLRGADITAACLRRVSLWGADLSGADADGADVSNWVGDPAATSSVRHWPHTAPAPSPCH